MNVKYMAVLAAVIMFAGCASVLAYADDADVDAVSADKTVYVLKGATAQVNIKQTLNGLNSYHNTVEWTYNSSGSEYKKIPGKASPETVGSASIWMAESNLTFDNESVTSDYVINVIGNDVTTQGETIKVKMTISSKVTQEDAEPLVQVLEYNILVNVLPSELTVTPTDYTVPNQVAVGTNGFLVPTYSVSNNEEDSGYLFYAVGLPDGVAMDSKGRLSGTPNVTNWDDVEGEAGSRVDDYTVTVYATHAASNLVIKGTFTLKVSENTNTFSINISASGDGDYVESTPNGFKSIGNNKLKVTIDETKTGVEYKVYYINETEGVQKDLGTINGVDGKTELTFTPSGTGEFTIVATNGSTMDSVRLIVVEPVADIQTGIAFQPGSYVN